MFCVSRESVEMWLTVGPYVLWVNGPLLLRWQITDTWPAPWSVTLVQTLNVSAIIGFSLLGMKLKTGLPIFHAVAEP